MADPTARRVCLIVTAEVTATTFYSGYLAYLATKGWNVYLIASSEGNLEAFGEEQGARVTAIPMRREPAPLHDIISLWRVVRALRTIRPAAVVAATPKAGLIGMLASYLCRVPTRVYQLWGLRLETEDGVRRKIYVALERASCWLSTQIVANSRSLASRALDLRVLADRPIEVLGDGSSHGVDVERFSVTAPMPAIDDKTSLFIQSGAAVPVVGFIGRVHSDKGIDTLVDAMASCAEQGLKFKLLIVGPVEDLALARRLATASERMSIHLTGAVADTRPYVRAMEVLCLPTRREGFPNVVLECAAMGVPAVVSDATGSVDSVVNEVSGLLFKTDSSTSLAQALTRLLENPVLRTQYGQAARDRARELFPRERVWRLQEEYLGTQVEQKRRRMRNSKSDTSRGMPDTAG